MNWEVGNQRIMLGSPGFEEHDGNLADVKVDVVFSFVSDERAEVPANDAVPSAMVPGLEIVFDVGCNLLILLNKQFL